MPYIYSEVDSLQEKPKVGSRQCVALLQYYAKLPSTSSWKEGKSVMEMGTIIKGMAIATYVGGKYQSLSTGNHAAYLISKDGNGIWIMDQWANSKKKMVSKRYIRCKGKPPSGAYREPSDNADAYSIIE